MDADAAAIIGLLFGGAGGYYSGKKRAEREASDLEKLIALYGGEGDKKSEEDDVEEALNNIAQNETESLYNKDGVRKNFLVDALKNTQFGSTAGTYDDPFAKYIRDDAEAINTEGLTPLYPRSYMDPTSPDYDEYNILNPLDWKWFGLGDDKFGDRIEGTLTKDYDLTELNNGGVVPKRGLVDEPGGYAGKFEEAFYNKAHPWVSAANTMGLLDLIQMMGGIFNEGGRVGYEQGGIVDLYKRMNHG